MKLTITDLGGGHFTIHDFAAKGIISLLENWEAGPSMLHFATDDGMAYIPKNAVARIDLVEAEPAAPDPV